MPLINSVKVLNKALKNGYAVPAFNINNLETLSSVIEVAEKLKKDTIISLSESAIEYAGLNQIVALVKSYTEKSKVNYVLHLDHGKSFAFCKKVIDTGFTSVMIDGSSLPFEQNVKLTKEVASYAHKFDVSVEGELGKIVGVEDLVSNSDEHFTDPKEALEFTKLTGVDSLAISVGTAHGINKSLATPKIRFDIIENVHKLIPKTPLVAHGSSTVPKHLVESINSNGGDIKKSQGIPEQTIAQMAKTAICKINIDTDLRLAFTSGVREHFRNKPNEFDPRKYLGAGKTALKAQIEHIYSLLG